jgi:hypothetical protein
VKALSVGLWKEKERILKEQRKSHERVKEPDASFKRIKESLADAETRFNRKLREQKRRENERLTQTTFEPKKE